MVVLLIFILLSIFCIIKYKRRKINRGYEIDRIRIQVGGNQIDLQCVLIARNGKRYETILCEEYMQFFLSAWSWPPHVSVREYKRCDSRKERREYSLNVSKTHITVKKLFGDPKEITSRLPMDFKLKVNGTGQTIYFREYVTIVSEHSWKRL